MDQAHTGMPPEQERENPCGKNQGDGQAREIGADMRDARRRVKSENRWLLNRSTGYMTANRVKVMSDGRCKGEHKCNAWAQCSRMQPKAQPAQRAQRAGRSLDHGLLSVAPSTR